MNNRQPNRNPKCVTIFRRNPIQPNFPSDPILKLPFPASQCCVNTSNTFHTHLISSHLYCRHTFRSDVPVNVRNLFGAVCVQRFSRLHIQNTYDIGCFASLFIWGLKNVAQTKSAEKGSVLNLFFYIKRRSIRYAKQGQIERICYTTTAITIDNWNLSARNGSVFQGGKVGNISNNMLDD